MCKILAVKKNFFLEKFLGQNFITFLMSTVQCDCANIRINGAEVCKYHHTGLSKDEQQEILGRSSPILHIPMYSISISDFKYVRFTQINDHHLIMNCLNCQAYHLYISNANLFLQIATDENHETFDESVSEQSIEDSIPNAFIAFFKREQSAEDDYDSIGCTSEIDNAESSNLIIDGDDDDYEYMFSNTTVPIVGSYVDGMINWVPEIIA